MDADTTSVGTAPRKEAGLLSSAASFFLPVGEQFDAHTVRGYYIDMRVKADTPTWPAPGYWLHVAAIQWGLGCYERYLAGEGEVWLHGAIACAEELIERQQADGPQAGGFLHEISLPHTFPLRPPWISAMAQGEGASLLVRAFGETREERFATAARSALLPLSVESRAQGAMALLDGHPFPEEYPTEPPSYVLNGAIFSMWGVHDVAIGLGDSAARVSFEQAVANLARNLHRWDTGYWSRYDLYPHPLTNVASSFYHDLHINQLRALNLLVPTAQLSETAARWQTYAASPARRRRAFAHKALFRLAVPRNRLLARRLPWSPLRRL